MESFGEQNAMQATASEVYDAAEAECRMNPSGTACSSQPALETATADIPLGPDKGTARVIIAHRLTTIKLHGRVYVMEHGDAPKPGSLDEPGSHDESRAHQ